ncbi:MAG: hypothetical protein AAFZ92_02360 [Pseudomonadota bacterium]
MVCRTELANGLVYNYCPNDLPPAADRMQSIVHGRFIDELTGQAVRAPLTVSTEMDYLLPRATNNGIAGLVANPMGRFPGLRLNSVDIDMTVAANRYMPRSFKRSLGPINTSVGAADNYPNFFAAIDLGDVNLHRAASVIKGRCVQDTGALSRAPLNNVTVAITGLWRRAPTTDVDPIMVMEPAHIVSLQQGLYRDRRAGTDVVRQRDLVPNAGEEKRLLAPVASGDRDCVLSNRLNLVAGNIIAIDSDQADLTEYIQISAVDGASTDTQAARITLAYPLLTQHRANANCVRVIPQVAAADNQFFRDAYSRDQSLFLDGLTGLNNSTIEVTDGIGVPEYHNAFLYRVLSDADGFFRLPPLTRIAQFQLTASRADLAQPLVQVLSPNYDVFENRADIIFR